MKTRIVLLTLFSGVILAIASFVYISRYLSRVSQIESAKREICFIEADLNQYKEIGNTYPSTAQGLEALVNRPTSEPLPADWVQSYQEVPLDIWQTPYRYRYPGTKDPTQPEIFSAGPDGIWDNEDDLSTRD